MITDEKIKEVKKMLRSGLPAGEVEEELRRQGYTNEDIQKAFPAHQYDMRSWYLVFAFILLGIGLWLYVDRQSLLGFALSALLFFAYYRETQRVKKSS